MFKPVRKAALISVLLITTPTVAFAGWMDQLGGVLGEATHNSQPAATATPFANLSNTDMVAGLKDALRVGSERVVGQLSKTDGFNKDPQIHIPLPENLQRVKSALGAVGMGYMMDDLELRLNRAAETATPKAKRIFGDAIKAMTINDARQILSGPNDAATQYFKGKMSKPLSDEMKPVVQQALNEAGAVQAYDSVMGQYQSLPFVPDVKANLTGHVLDLGLQGIFHYMASEEAAIRHNPVARTTSILKKVFANQ
ncbi:MAG: DUF4197 domain-containing protein [Zetaproteobacteria bacterium CG12_big_fil_rev_8_21_14_0_65_54_13]|nr:MAG: DUF4197 domain-containing protein [Zetaproteobacteria bacterium CG12_big_fil_rev_8_21_14_0_65_54_13]PIX54444.1 MAG: DUF4197 domain-containing protein [Zetaproteobacteria bacterium CG_4_10_14_3_um_filter_54_28]PJA28844.1 MAG: DUF4197 domain-containing protein [Zetaproteobacteria bacterium CG_4_9_14_3_um_filter_54_145]